nr:protein PLASTID MOVEMENT IMPAIRED 1 [Ipomoea batatas]
MSTCTKSKFNLKASRDAAQHPLHLQYYEVSTTCRTQELRLSDTSAQSWSSSSEKQFSSLAQLAFSLKRRYSERNRISRRSSFEQLHVLEIELFRVVKEKVGGSLSLSALAEEKGDRIKRPLYLEVRLAMKDLGIQRLFQVIWCNSLIPKLDGMLAYVCEVKLAMKDLGIQRNDSRKSPGKAPILALLLPDCDYDCTEADDDRIELLLSQKTPPFTFLFSVIAFDFPCCFFLPSSMSSSLHKSTDLGKSTKSLEDRWWNIVYVLANPPMGGGDVQFLLFIMLEFGRIIVGSQSTKLLHPKKFEYTALARAGSPERMSLSPKKETRDGAVQTMPSRKLIATDLQGIDELNLDEPAVTMPAAQEFVKEPDEKAEDLDIPDFDVVDKGVEIQEKDRAEDELSEENSNSDKRSVSSEVVKEIVQDQFHLTRMTELDSIAQQIKALESMLGDESSVKTEEETQSQGLDADEETVTREFLQMLEDSDTNQFKVNRQALQLEEDENSGKKVSEVFLPDLGKGLGCVVQTRNGGYLASLNPLNVALARTDSPKLAMQMSKPLVLPSHTSVNGIELFQRMAAAGVEEMSSQILALMPMDELIGKTAEQIAFEGIASSIIQGRNKEGASSSAARTVAVVKSMANAMNSGRKVRISTGIWNVSEDPLTAEEILAFSMQKIEEMTVEALKIQAGIAEEQAPFDVSAINVKEKSHPLAHAVPLEDWVRDNSVATSNDDNNGSTENIAIFVVVQLRDPLRQYEAVGGPMIALIQAAHVDMGPDNYDEEKRFKVATLHIGGLRMKSGGKKNVWDTEKQRLTAMQWLIAYGLGKIGKKGKHQATKGQELIWSISSRIMADMWLKPIRNPDVKFTK